MKKLFTTLVLVLAWALHTEAEEKAPHYTVIVSLDGCRWDYPEMYDTPHFDRMAAEGVKAAMTASFPSKTFPNHYTLATGLVPDHHGIVANSFWCMEKNIRYTMGNPETRNDPYFYLGEPIWVTAQKQGLKTGNLYWVGSDIPIMNTYPTYYKVYAQTPRLTFSERVQGVLDFLNLPEDERPRLIMAYFEEPDHNGHTYGPQAKETRQVIEELDKYIGQLWEGIQKLPIAGQVNLIVTSDHGMTSISPDRTISVRQHIKEEWYEQIDGNLPGLIYTKPAFRDSVYNALKDVPHIQVWKKEQMPAYLNYGTSDRIGDIVVLPDLGWLFTDEPVIQQGTHGFDPEFSDMKVMFRACGPDFKKGYVSKGFVNVDIYSLLCHLLHITPETTDGDFNRIKDILAHE